MTTSARATRLAASLVRLSHEVQHVFTDVSREHDLTPQQAQLLCVLAAGPHRMTQLTRMLHLEKSSVTGLVDRVERRGLAERMRDGHDRRACSVALTAEGKRLAHRVHDAVVRRLAGVLDGISAADAERLTSVLTRFTQPELRRGA